MAYDPLKRYSELGDDKRNLPTTPDGQRVTNTTKLGKKPEPKKPVSPDTAQQKQGGEGNKGGDVIKTGSDFSGTGSATTPDEPPVGIRKPDLPVGTPTVGQIDTIVKDTVNQTNADRIAKIKQDQLGAFNSDGTRLADASGKPVDQAGLLADPNKFTGEVRNEKGELLFAQGPNGGSLTVVPSARFIDPDGKGLSLLGNTQSQGQQQQSRRQQGMTVNQRYNLIKRAIKDFTSTGRVGPSKLAKIMEQVFGTKDNQDKLRLGYSDIASKESIAEANRLATSRDQRARNLSNETIAELNRSADAASLVSSNFYKDQDNQLRREELAQKQARLGVETGQNAARIAETQAKNATDQTLQTAKIMMQMIGDPSTPEDEVTQLQKTVVELLSGLE